MIRSDVRRRALILLVDDVATNLTLLSEILEADYELMVATSGAEAIELAGGEEMPDLILLDVMMPGLTGYDVCRALKRQDSTRHIPIIFVTALGGSEDEVRGFALGAVDYVTKPFSRVVVQARVRAHLALKHRTDLLESLAFQDGLTGVANRRAFDGRLEEEWRRAARLGFPLSLLMIDVDHFKSYNDHHGHGLGDDALRRIAQAADEFARRPGDLVARYGGEEFVVILPAADLDGAMAIGEALRARVEKLAIPHAESPVSPWVTISVGVGTAQSHAGDSVNHLVNRADDALYRAKNSGRNRVATQPL